MVKVVETQEPEAVEETEETTEETTATEETQGDTHLVDTATIEVPSEESVEKSKRRTRKR